MWIGMKTSSQNTMDFLTLLMINLLVEISYFNSSIDENYHIESKNEGIVITNNIKRLSQLISSVEEEIDLDYLIFSTMYQDQLPRTIYLKLINPLIYNLMILSNNGQRFFLVRLISYNTQVTALVLVKPQLVLVKTEVVRGTFYSIAISRKNSFSFLIEIRLCDTGNCT